MANLPDPAMSINAQRRKKPLTYGRATRNTQFTPQGVGSFFDESDKSHRTGLRRLNPVTKPHVPAKRQLSVRDEFDVPDSDDENALHQSNLTRISRDEFDVPVSDDEPVLEHSRAGGIKPARQPRISSMSVTTAPSPRRAQAKGVVHASVKALRDKRKSIEDAPDTPTQKRTSSPASPITGDENATIVDNTRIVDTAIFAPSIRSSGTSQTNTRRSWRNQSKTTLTHVSPTKGLSAPARLNEMLSSLEDRDSAHDANHPSHVLSDLSLSPGTPNRDSPARPAPLRRTTSSTPKQSKLWSQLLDSDPVEEDAGAPRINTRLNFKPSPSTAKHANSQGSKGPVLSTAPSAAPRQTRLVDRLKQTHQTLDDSASEDDDGISEKASSADAEIRPPNPRTVTFNGVQKLPVPDSQSQATNSQNSLPTKMTYARTRSYLNEDSLEESLMLSFPTAAPARPLASTRRTATSVKSQTNFDVDDDSDDGAAGGIRSIHELRAAGSKKRFMDDNTVLFDDIKDHKIASRSRRRSALMELATKLSEKSYLARFIEHGFDRKLADKLTPPYPDLISDTTLCAVLSQIMVIDAGEKSLLTLHTTGALDVASRCLAGNKAISREIADRRNNMSKVAQSTYLEFIESIRTSQLWTEAQPEALTIRLLGLKCMELMVLRLRRQGNKGSVLHADTVAKLVDIAAQVDDSTPVDDSTSSQAVARRMSLSVLEFASTSDALATTWSPELWEPLISILPTILQLQDDSKPLMLKLCINLTNNNPQNCNATSQPAPIKAIVHQIVDGFRHLHDPSDEQESKSRLDSLILSLGLMINLAEFSDTACDETATIQDEDDNLAAMVTAFLHGQQRIEDAESEEETQGNVAYGFLAVLLGNLCQTPKAREVVRARLPGKKLDVLIDTIDEFAQYNRKVDSQTFEGDEGRDVWEQFTGRLMAVVARLREFGV